ncbi:hypothetical protein Pla110_06900 [Polystyrenella longa]|uniref:Uncharacterized protein n=1 Tax=Polystyrenella longa TaxID=2528007 RepID=A0A518CIC8_9PLAN|nr:hypothetical protein [Polystyrenella longa]QDU78986.1 hypothetical protein Pla110_06900 [Polystyrenella longa]
MSNLFVRMNTDRSETPASLENMFAGSTSTSCWLIGGGPSLTEESAKIIQQTPSPRMCINLAGAGLIRPTFWTSYDPSTRFHKSIYFDAGITKFVHKRRALDLVPESSFKVCDCPNLYFFDRQRDRQFHDFLAPHHSGIVDWSDSMVQAIDILYRLGFRTLFLVGCEMRVQPSVAQQTRAREAGVVYESGELLKDFLRRCEEKGLSVEELESVEREEQYHFAETKSLKAAASAESHYFRIAQYLRLCRRAMSLAGLRLVSVTPESRLNDYFPYLSLDEAAFEIKNETGDPAVETTDGLYRQLTDRRVDFRGPMRDFKPPVDQSRESPEPQRKRDNQHEFLVEAEGFENKKPRAAGAGQLRLQAQHMEQVPVHVKEEG